mmetsp:Transcript_14499/g.1311  ORF Transcript_14499/g.1311 Transcript_14499/m.1311 type:complete len:80 (-) Transcript_14499:744-983(-)
MIRLVFRPFTQVWKSICTSEDLASFHQSFPWLHPTQVKFIIFRVVTYSLLLEPFVRDARSAVAVNNLSLVSLCVRVFPP